MNTPRETIYAALFDQFSQISGIVTASRRAQPMERLGSEKLPGLLFEQVEEVGTKRTGFPTIWHLKLRVYLYVDTGENIDNVIPTSTVNPLVDSVEAALDMMAGGSNRNANLGLAGVTEARLSGPIEYHEDMQRPRMITVLPIEIVLTS